MGCQGQCSILPPPLNWGAAVVLRRGLSSCQGFDQGKAGVSKAPPPSLFWLQKGWLPHVLSVCPCRRGPWAPQDTCALLGDTPPTTTQRQSW